MGARSGFLKRCWRGRGSRERRAPSSEGWLRRGRRAAGYALVTLFALIGVEQWSALSYLSSVYGSLGAGVWPVALSLFALTGLVLAGAAYPLLRPWLSHAADQRRLAALLSIGAVLMGASSSLSLLLGQARAARDADGVLSEQRVAQALSSLASLAERLPSGPGPSSLMTDALATCDLGLAADAISVVVAYRTRSAQGRVALECFQAPTLGASVEAVRERLLERASRGPIKLDVISAARAIGWRHPWLHALELRPGRDGICAARRCLMPWQLLSAGYFSSYRPLSFIQDLQLGASLTDLARALDAEGRSVASLLRVTTYGYVLDLSRSPAALTPLRRMRPLDVELSGERLERAGALAERHLLGAQLESGKFRYTLEPFTGAADEHGFNLARQAGALLALCELGQSSPLVDAAVRRGLGVFRDFERRGGALGALSTDPAATRVRLGETGLPLVSLLACGSRTGSAFDELIARLARYLLATQLPDGSFARHFDLPTGTAVPDMQPLYASGQAVLSLLLLEKRQRENPSPAFPPLAALSDAAERAMSYFAHDYWTHPLRDFFFLEENWHCLAAREALSVHRHAAYEDFCWDYVTFKSRLILDARDGVDPEFDGGFGFGNVVPPHNTGAAGFAEALAAALAVRGARGEAEPEARELLGRVLRFILRQQWTEDNCFACADARVLGGMSEHTHSALTRIDFAQHAWAGLGHGGRVLGLID